MDYAPLKARFPGGVLSVAQENGQDAIEVTRDAAHDVLKALKDEHGHRIPYEMVTPAHVELR